MTAEDAAAETLERQRASDKALAALRSEGLARSLVVHCTGLRTNSTNFDTALSYVHQNLKHHKFADMGHDAFAVRKDYEGLLERLECLSEHSKAHALRALCTELCASSSNGAWEWRPQHNGVQNGVAALSTLYWLANSSKMAKAPPPTLPPSSLSGRRRQGYARSAEEANEAAAAADVRAAAVVESWGYSDGEEDEEAGDEPPLSPEVQATGQGAYDDYDDKDEATPPSDKAPHAPWAVRPRARLGKPPRRLHLDLIGGATMRSGVFGCFPPSATLTGEHDPPSAHQRAERIAQLRVLREYLRALAAGVGGAVWSVSSSPGAVCDGSEGRELLRTQPSSSTSMLGDLGRIATHANNLREFAHAISQRPAAPSVLLALSDALLEELQPLTSYMWAHDGHAKRSQHDAAVERPPRLHDGTQPSLLELMQRLRRGDDGHPPPAEPQQQQQSPQQQHGSSSSSGGGGGGSSSGGWMRKLAALDGLRVQLVASAAVNALVNGEAYASEDGAAMAASHTIDTLMKACEHEQLMGGESYGGGGSEEEEGGAYNAVSSGAMSLLPLYLRLLSAALLPYLRNLHSWIGSGRYHDLAGEMPFRSDSAIAPLSDAEYHWAHGFALRPDGAVPLILRPLAKEIVLAGKSRHLLNRMNLSGQRGGEVVELPLPPLDTAFCNALTRALSSRRTTLVNATPMMSGQQPQPRAPPPLAPSDPRIYPNPRRGLLPSDNKQPQQTILDARAYEEGDDEAVAAVCGMAALHPHTDLPSAPPPRADAERLLDARRGLCYLRTTPRAIDADDDDLNPLAALDAMRSALGHPPPPTATAAPLPTTHSSSKTETRNDGHEPPSVTAAALALPPLSLLIDRCLLTPLRQRCAAAGPLLLAAVSSHFDPRLAASLLHRVTLFAEPRLTAPFLDTLFARLSLHHGAWRRQLPELHAMLHDGLLNADVPPFAAECFAVEMASSADGNAPPSSGGLDSADVRALSSLRLRFNLQWPLQLAISEASLATHEKVFGLLVMLRRARWALETAENGSEAAADGSSGGGGGRVGGSDAWRQCAHPWRVLRAEVLHLVSAIYAHLTLGVIHPEWRAFEQTVIDAKENHVDAFRTAHESFAARVARGCLLSDSDLPIRNAIERILGLALRLRLQLDDLPRLDANQHAANAAGWRRELRSGVVFVLTELKRAAEQEARPELIDLCRLIDYNNHYDSETSTAAASPGARKFALRDGL